MRREAPASKDVSAAASEVSDRGPSEAWAALAAECERVSTTVLDLPEEDFARPTRCTAWNVKELLGHVYRDVDRINTALESRSPDRPDSDSVDYWRRYDPSPESTDSRAVARRAKEIAAAFETGRELAEAFDRDWRRTLDRAAGADPGRIVVTWGPALSFEELLRTRVLELTVHGADLADALGRPPWPTDDGLRITTAILRELLGTDPPSGLEWSPLEFVEAGTGRRALTERDRDALGALAGRFPLIG